VRSACRWAGYFRIEVVLLDRSQLRLGGAAFEMTTAPQKPCIIWPQFATNSSVGMP
jgi:hypothetical protein